MIDEKIIKNIYSRLQDEESKAIYSGRLLYSLTDDENKLRDVISLSSGGIQLCQTLKKHVNQRKVLFGAGFWGRKILHFFPDEGWCCFADNKISSGSCIDGLLVIDIEKLVKEYLDSYIVISTRLYYKEIAQQLRQAGIEDKNIFSIGEIEDQMIKSQYFERGIVSFKENYSFVDCGAFDGKTSENFIDLSNGKFGHIYAFEPDRIMAAKCRDSFKEFKNVNVIEKGVWNYESILHFRADGAMSQIIVDDDNKRHSMTSIPVTSLDNELLGKNINLIKMDIEGSEYAALVGAKKIIQQQKPDLAISIYHRKSDIWVLPELILSLNPDYRLFLRHYTLCEYDTVLYAVK